MNTQVRTHPSSSWTRSLIAIAAISALALSLLTMFRPMTALGFTAGDNGHPTSGESSDLKGGSATFTFQQNAILYCVQDDTASSFVFHVDYDVTGTLPAGATLVVYLSPNQGAINNNAGGDEAGYTADVESNFGTLDIGGLTGSGTLDISVNVATAFQASGGGILGVIARESDETIVSSSKTNSLNCTEATSTPTPTPVVTPTPTPVVTPTPTPVVTPTPTPVVTPTPTPTPEESVAGNTGTPAPTQTPEQSVEAATGTPAASVPNTAVGASNGTNQQLPTILFGLLLVASLGGLLVLNVRSAIERR